MPTFSNNICDRFESEIDRVLCFFLGVSKLFTKIKVKFTLLIFPDNIPSYISLETKSLEILEDQSFFFTSFWF